MSHIATLIENRMKSSAALQKDNPLALKEPDKSFQFKHCKM